MRDKSVIIIFIAAVFVFLNVRIAASDLVCTTREGSCAAGEVVIFKLSDNDLTNDAGNAIPGPHAELPTQTNYKWFVCCKDTSGVSIGNECIPAGGRERVVLFNLTSPTNAHAWLPNSGSGVGYPVCISYASATANCYATSGSCNPGYECIAKLTAETNAHISNCTSDFPYSICCSLTPIAALPVTPLQIEWVKPSITPIDVKEGENVEFEVYVVNKSAPIARVQLLREEDGEVKIIKDMEFDKMEEHGEEKRWHYTASMSYDDFKWGDNIMLANVTDKNGNTLRTDSERVIIKKAIEIRYEKPTPEDGSVLYSDKFIINVSVKNYTAEIETVKFTVTAEINSVPFNYEPTISGDRYDFVKDGRFFYHIELTSLSLGTYTFKASATDKDGYSDETEKRSVTISGIGGLSVGIDIVPVVQEDDRKYTNVTEVDLKLTYQDVDNKRCYLRNDSMAWEDIPCADSYSGWELINKDGTRTVWFNETNGTHEGIASDSIILDRTHPWSSLSAGRELHDISTDGTKITFSLSGDDPPLPDGSYGVGIKCYNISYNFTDGTTWYGWRVWNDCVTTNTEFDLEEFAKNTLGPGKTANDLDGYIFFFKSEAIDKLLNKEKKKGYDVKKIIYAPKCIKTYVKTGSDTIISKEGGIASARSKATIVVESRPGCTLTNIEINYTAHPIHEPKSNWEWEQSSCSGAPCSVDVGPFNEDMEIKYYVKAKISSGGKEKSPPTAPNDLWYFYMLYRPIAEFEEHNVVLKLGRRYNIRIKVRNIQPVRSDINVQLSLSKGKGRIQQYVYFPDSTNFIRTVTLNPQEEKVINATFYANKEGVYSIGLTAWSLSNPNLQDNDIMNIKVVMYKELSEINVYSLMVLFIASLIIFAFIHSRLF
ncbi:MAG TPA: hypothetical protein ENG42_03385 [Candidatus Aenigmarchaeota archaeon]|nr:MAG: hypothetical protein DRP03_02150 [Candidatus Aenigmarchaeota archaeon]HDD46495.1 hypothetical protein [Candidatus Aenigmarchaeota archaeon]